MRVGAIAVVVAVSILSGCRAADRNLMPMEVGSVARYEVKAPFNEFIGEVRVVRKSAVGGLDGFVLSGPSGEAHLAWQDQTLVAERTSNVRFSPPIPLVVDSPKPVRKKWSGTVQGYWGKYDADGILDQAMVASFEGKKGVKSVLTIEGKAQKAIRLTTLFQPGVGIAFQRQEIGGDSIVTIERLSGP